MQKTQALVRGVVADVIIPHSKAEEVDLDRLKSEVQFLDQNGVDALSIGGVLGGLIGATADELASVCSAARQATRKPIFAILFPDASTEGYEMVRAVDEAGADVILISQPHYLAQPAIDGLEEMFAEARRITDRPLLVADCLPGCILGARALRSLAEKQLVDGLFEAADMHVVVDLLCMHPDVPVYAGVEDLHFTSLVLGARGVISNLASVFPRECAAVSAAVRSGRHDEARKIHERLVRLWRALSVGTQREARLRIAVESSGRPVGPARSPYGKLPPEVGLQISGVLKKEGITA
ncbi:MAG TPA: dihydrodipicolinate synthase family protein [Candidatus Sulfotelmatobacter sp.]|nr:dihydrodipicolinate synthase family protein [Candidatus Sulfotelmatobacter sp.]